MIDGDERSARGRYGLELAAVLALLGLFLSLMSAYDTVGAGIGSKAFLVGRMALLIGLCTLFLRRGGERWADLGLRRPKRWWMVPLLAAFGFVLLLALTAWLRGTLFPAIGAPPPPPSALAAIRGDLPQYLFYGFLVSWGSAAFGEELLLRGFVLDRLAKLFGSTSTAALLLAILVQAALFGAFHFHQGANALVAAAAGLVFGLIWLLGGRNLWACILLHGLVDFLTATDYYLASAPS
jgi:hypothetical protein